MSKAKQDHSQHSEHDHSEHDHSEHDHSMHDHGGHDEHADHSDHSHHDPNAFKRLFWIALILTVPVVIYSEAIQQLLGFTPPKFIFSEFIPAVLGTFLFFYGGRVFLNGGVSEVKGKKPGMMALISLALIVSFGYSLFVTTLDLFGIMWMGMDFWWELATLISIMLLGHWIEMASIARASGALSELAKLVPDTAEKVVGKKTVTVPVSELVVGDQVLVRPGASIPVDGQITQGSSSIDESMLSGESKPVEKEVGSEVFAGSINGSSAKLGKGSLTISVGAIGSSTLLSGIVRLVAEAQKSKSKTQLLADRAAGWLFYLAFVSAILTLIFWVSTGEASADFILEKVVTVLIIACPHALGLAIPLVSSITSARAAKSGLIIRNKGDFETARKLDIVLFDKTGTLTTASRSVLDYKLSKNSTLKTPEQLVRLAASLEKDSEHSLGHAILEKAEELGQNLRVASSVEFIPGVGVSAEVSGAKVMVGSAKLLTASDVQVDVADFMAVDAETSAGNSVVYVVKDNIFEGFLVVGDQIRQSSKQAVDDLKALGKPVAIVSGDAKGVVESVAKQLGIKEFYAELLPADKIELVKKLQSQGLKVGFVGDGVNDAPALAQADVGMAIGAGTDVAIESAGVVLVSSDPSSVAEVISLAKRSHTKMIQNLWWAAGYNLLAIPAAAGAFSSWGFDLSPAVGAVLMSLSTLIVAFNAQLLRRG